MEVVLNKKMKILKNKKVDIKLIEDSSMSNLRQTGV